MTTASSCFRMIQKSPAVNSLSIGKSGLEKNRGSGCNLFYKIVYRRSLKQKLCSYSYNMTCLKAEHLLKGAAYFQLLPQLSISPAFQGVWAPLDRAGRQCAWECFMTPAEPQLMGLLSSSPSGCQQPLFLQFTFPSNIRNIDNPITCVSDWIQSQNNCDITWITVSSCSKSKITRPSQNSCRSLTTASLCRKLLLIAAISMCLHPDPSCALPLAAAKPTLHLCRLADLHPTCYPASLLPSQVNDLIAWSNFSLPGQRTYTHIVHAALLPSFLQGTRVPALDTMSVLFFRLSSPYSSTCICMMLSAFPHPAEGPDLRIGKDEYSISNARKLKM